jgi:membrane protein implicated in regulation of membrane protease activity
VTVSNGAQQEETMSESMGWLIAAGVLVVLELFSGTFYLLMIALGLSAGALAAFAGLGMALQLITAAVVGIIATVVLHRSRFGHSQRGNSARDPNVNIDIGQRLEVERWQDGHARVKYRGALWDVELGPGAQAQPGTFKIVEVQGSRLIVSGA